MAVLSHRMVMRLYTGRCAPVAVNVECRYQTEDPYAVELHFPAEHPAATDWVFARELLADGLRAAAGEGDVRVEPADEAATLITFGHIGQGFVLLEAPTGELNEFLTRTFDRVPPGAETQLVEWPADITSLLDE